LTKEIHASLRKEAVVSPVSELLTHVGKTLDGHLMKRLPFATSLAQNQAWMKHQIEPTRSQLSDQGEGTEIHLFREN